MSLGGSPASAAELAHSLSHPMRKLAYHLTVLAKGGYVEAVDGGDADSFGTRYESSRA